MFFTKRQKNKQPEFYIHFCIPLSTAIEFDTNQIMKKFREQWGIKIACGENPEWSDSDMKIRKYLLTDGANNLLISVDERPLPSYLSNFSIDSVHNLDADESSSFLDHKAYILIKYVMGDSSAMERVKFSVQSLLTLLQYDSAIGYVNVSGQVYRPKIMVEPLFERTFLEPIDLFLLCTNTHLVKNDSEHWIHTHGMEQFGLPDIQVKFTENAKASYYRELLNNTAIYCIKNGPVLQVGDTAELAGDGVMYKINAVKKDAEHPYGHFGAIEITKQ